MTNTTKPISPNEVVALKEKLVPSGVYECINELIARHFNGSSSTFAIKLVIPEIASKIGMSIEYVRRMRYEDAIWMYEKAGWIVEEVLYEEGDSVYVFKPRPVPSTTDGWRA